MTWITKPDDPGAMPSPELAAWTEEARQALVQAAPNAHTFLVACLASRIATARARDGHQAARRLQNYCARLLRRPAS